MIKTQNIEFIPVKTSIKKVPGQSDKLKSFVVLLKFLPSFQSLIIALIIMFAINWKMTLIILAFTPAPSLIAYSFSLKHVTRTIQLMNKRAVIFIGFNEVFVYLIIIRNFARANNKKVQGLLNSGLNNSDQIMYKHGNNCPSLRGSAVTA
jgi:ABC-type multidrug transport system fused ATPase/permease subunit